MCGLAGIVRPEAAPLDPARARAALQAMAHRGPDAAGCLAWDRGETRCGADPAALAGAARVVLIHRRLSIIDLSDAARQPMSSADGRYHLVLNGEIYNYRELAPELARLGWSFRTSSDSEVLLAALAHWGAAALVRLVGMFAFAFLDTNRGTVLLARDPFGIKPLYYGRHDGSLVFASELPALFTLADLPRGADAARLFRFLRWGESEHDEGTLFAAVRQLPPGSWRAVDVATGAESEGTFWQAPREVRIVPFAEAVAGARERFLRNIELHLRSDVPVGAALSGGIDSSAIVSAMRVVAGDSLDLHAFSYVADDPAISEGRWSALVAEHAGAHRHVVRATPEELQADLPRLVAVQGEPFASTRIYAQYRVFQAARAAGVTVMLDGQGADELLAGYHYFLGPRLADLLRRGQLGAAARLARGATRPPGLARSALGMYVAAALLPGPLQAAARRLARREAAPPWLGRGWFAEQGVAMVTPPRPGGGTFHGALLDSLTSSSLPHLLRYEDRNSMAFSIESRVPFLTPSLAEWTVTLPADCLIDPQGTTKAVFRAAMRGFVPDAILDRRDKIGFETPERRWLEALRPWVEAELASDVAAAIPALRRDAMLREWHAIRAGRRRFDWRVWRWVNVIAWTRQCGVTYA